MTSLNLMAYLELTSGRMKSGKLRKAVVELVTEVQSLQQEIYQLKLERAKGIQHFNQPSTAAPSRSKAVRPLEMGSV